VVESWQNLRKEIVKIFDRQVPFFRIMQRIEARKWIQGKETFDEYAIEKLALMYRVDLPEQDKIQLLVSGITTVPLRVTALSLSTESIDGFLEKMRRITQGTAEFNRRSRTLQPQPKRVPVKIVGRRDTIIKTAVTRQIVFIAKKKDTNDLTVRF